MDTASAMDAPRGGPPKVVVVGNSKGGTGKSTVAVHLSVGLLYKGYEVGVVDADPDQGTTTRYLANRRSWRSLDPLTVTGAVRRFPMPRQAQLTGARGVSLRGEETAARHVMEKALAELAECDFVIIDTPGSPSAFSHVGHERADVLVTPINDSFVDIDVLAEIDTASRTVIAPSRYSRMVMDIGARCHAAGRMSPDWLVIRNRLPHVYSRNRRDIDLLMSKLGDRLGFREAPGFGERVAFREHFLTGLTVLDLPSMGAEQTTRTSRLTAESEVERLLAAIAGSSRTVPARTVLGA